MTLESISLMSNYNELNRKVKKGEKKRQKQRSDRRIELFGERKDEEMKLHFQLFFLSFVYINGLMGWFFWFGKIAGTVKGCTAVLLGVIIMAIESHPHEKV